MTQVDFYDKEQIDAKEIGAPDDAASATGGLWARLKNAVARIISLETADTDNVKKTGISTVTGNVQVPTTPATPTSVVNSAYVNDATQGVNNILHKAGLETITSPKIISGVGFQFEQIVDQGYMRALILKNLNHEWVSGTPPGSALYFPAIEIRDSADRNLGEMRFILNTDNTTTFEVRVINSNGTKKTVVSGKGDVI